MEPQPSHHGGESPNKHEPAPKQPIPELRPHYNGDGHEWVERLPSGWEAVSSWGRDGWDLGAWPICVVAMYDNDQTHQYAVGIYTEGDVTVRHIPNQDELYFAVDQLAEWYWRNDYASGPNDLPPHHGLLPPHRGPFSWRRLDRERPRDENDA